MTRIPHLVRAIFTVGLAWMILIGAINVGLAMPGLEFLKGFGGEGSLDYSHRSGLFSPLTRGFIARILGLGQEQVGSSASASATSRPGRPSATSGRLTDVQHPFTNDEFEQAYEISSLPFRGRTNTAGATRRSGEPGDCLPAGGTAWYRYTPRSDVALFADTFGTSGEAALGIYKGNSLGTLSPMGCDHNVLGNAQVGFRASAGQAYYFQITSLRGGPTVFELAAVGPTTLETMSASGGRPDAPSSAPYNRADISGDGRFVVFVSLARNLTSTRAECGGGEECDSVYLRDRVTGQTNLIASATGIPAFPGHDALFFPSLSADGRYLAFSANEVPGRPGFHGPTEAQQMAVNAYLYDRITGSLELVGRNSNGEMARPQPGSDGYTVTPGQSGTYIPSISTDGRYVTFFSDGANLGGHVEYGKAFNVYRRDRVTGITRLVSTDSEGRPMRANSFAGSGRNMSGDGRYVFFASTFGNGQADGQVACHGLYHLYLWDSSTGRTRQVTKLPEGVQTKGNYCPSISLDGTRTAFVSHDALVPEDTNGTPDVYAYEVATGRLKRVSVTSAGEQTRDLNFYSTEGSDVLPRAVSLSGDGRYIAFDSSASELTPSSTGSTRYAGPGSPGPIQVYVHDIVTGSTVLASVSSTGEPLPGNSVLPYISHDGRRVSFMNSGYWTNQNSVTQMDVFVHELR